MEKKLKAYVDKVEAKYEDFNVMDAFTGFSTNHNRGAIEAFNEGDRSRSNSPQNGRQKGTISK